MGDHDPGVDTYIARAAPFARPILEHLRQLVHATCPAAEESLKWRMPFFSYRGSPLCMMAAFKQHCGFGFWLAREMVGEWAGEGMGQFGKLTAVADLPPSKTLVAHLRQAMALNESGAKIRRPKAAQKPPPSLPDDFAALLAQRKHAVARRCYNSFTPGAQREYVDWINEAKTDATRQKRIMTSLAWLAEGKPRNWKYRS